MTNKVNSDDAPIGFRAAPGFGVCVGCAFYAELADPDWTRCWQSACGPSARDDRQHVIFIKKE